MVSGVVEGFGLRRGVTWSGGVRSFKTERNKACVCAGAGVCDRDGVHLGGGVRRW